MRIAGGCILGSVDKRFISMQSSRVYCIYNLAYGLVDPPFALA